MLDVTGGQKKVSRVKETVVGQSLLLSRMLWWGGVWAEARVKGGTSPVSGVEEQCRGPDAGAPLDNCVETVSVKHPSVCREAPWLVPGGKHSRYLEFSENSIAHLAKGGRVPREETGLELAACRPQGFFSERSGKPQLRTGAAIL